MHIRIRDRFRNIKIQKKYIPIYGASLLLVLHTFVVAYINSSFLGQYIDEASIGTIYTIGSALTVLIFLFVSRVLRRVGNYKMIMGMLFLDFIATLGMAMSETLRVAIPLFLVHITVLPLIVFNIDVFMEEKIGDHESQTGKTRGLLLALMSLIGAFAPLIGGLLVDDTTGSFKSAYVLSAIVLIPVMMILFRYFKYFEDPRYTEVKVLPSLRAFWVDRDIRFALLSHFTLQIFFFWMVVYAPLYLATQMHFSWEEIGLIIFVAQFAYVFLEYPIGLIADTYIGEKEMMAFGFVILAVASSWMAFLDGDSVIPWMVAMFIVRIGASLTEVTSESYFFKHTKGSDTNYISFFRITRPVAFVIGSLIGSLTLLYLTFNLSFVILGLLMIPGLFYTMALKDTK